MTPPSIHNTHTHIASLLEGEREQPFSVVAAERSLYKVSQLLQCMDVA